MPWCEACARFWNPNTLRVDGTCPSCGRQIADPMPVEAEAEIKAPWHFWLLIVAAAVYLTWRFLQLFGVGG